MKKLNSINLDSCKPNGYISTKESGIFSSYSDGCETAFDYKNIDKLDVKTFDKYISQAQKAKKTDSLGKLVTDYEWYFACKVSADDVKNIDDGDILNVALKDSDKVIECEVISGATLDLGVKESVLILRSSEMDSEIASMRLEDIEIDLTNTPDLRCLLQQFILTIRVKRWFIPLLQIRLKAEKGTLFIQQRIM